MRILLTSVLALLAILAVGWGLGKVKLHEQLAAGLPAPLGRLATAWVRYVVPASLAAILAGFLIGNV